MWKAMMFSVRPVRTASAALRTRRQIVRYQKETIGMCVTSCLLVRVIHLLSRWELQSKVKVNTSCELFHTHLPPEKVSMSNSQMNVNLC